MSCVWNYTSCVYLQDMLAWPELITGILSELDI